MIYSGGKKTHGGGNNNPLPTGWVMDHGPLNLRKLKSCEACFNWFLHPSSNSDKDKVQSDVGKGAGLCESVQPLAL